MAWDEDAPVDEGQVVVASFMKDSALAAMPTYKPCNKGFRLSCGYGNVQLFNLQRANTFIHLRKPPVNSGEEIIVSIALQQISQRVQKVLPDVVRRCIDADALPQQVGRVNRTPVVGIEIHVVSNRDRVAHELFDLRFEQ